MKRHSTLHCVRKASLLGRGVVGKVAADPVGKTKAFQCARRNNDGVVFTSVYLFDALLDCASNRLGCGIGIDLSDPFDRAALGPGPQDRKDQ